MDETAGLPGSDADYPSQDEVDRRGHLAFIVYFGARLPDPFVYEWELVEALRDLYRPAFRDLGAEMSAAVADAVREAAGLELFPKPLAVQYQIGPAAGGLGLSSDLILTLAERLDDIPAAFDLLANSWAIAHIARLVYAKMRAWVSRQQGGEQLDLILAFPPMVLTDLCKDHVRRSYHPRAKLTTDWYSTTAEYYGGFGSPAHPTSIQTYLVTVAAGRRTYCYAIDGTGRVGTHYVMDGQRRIELPTPDLFNGAD